MINLIKGDCLNVLANIEDKYIDCIITSPPYDNLRNYNGTLEWNFDKFKKIARELCRVLKDGGVIVWVVADATIKGSETGTSFKQALFFQELGLNLHDTMIWVKDGGGAVGSNLCYTQNFEYMFVLSKGKPKSINLIYDKPNLSYGVDKSGIGRRKSNEQLKVEKRKPSKEFSRRNNWWYIPTQKGIGHPAVFPERLAQDHIISWTNENDIILDPFMGSGTVGKMCKLLNRNFIGIDIVDKYIEISKKRIFD